MTEELVDTKQAAKILGVTPRRVLALVEDGRLTAVIKAGRNHLFLAEDVRKVERKKGGRPFGSKNKPKDQPIASAGKRRPVKKRSK
jgi:excisionase family DNA binding protein